MAVQNPFFGKRDNDTFSSRNSMTGLSSSSPSSLGSGSLAGSGTTSPGSTARTASASAPAASEETGGSKLTVGPNIKLKGVEITDCDTLVVEGTVEATMNSRVIRIAEQGAFHGTAEIDIAEIHGVFDGTLTVREKLVIFGSGRVSGKIRYGKVVIEEGGELTGQIEAGSSKSGNGYSAARSESAAPAAASASSAASSASQAPMAATSSSMVV
ncbi:polymer-forming cytoskeletal protein [Comamonas sp. w2-DMI]|uniref:bactofilin family protein n=1 Tax=Comamonas sp. w2-DMI TaxID=3126391 RepID=UPI0032E3CE25